MTSKRSGQTPRLVELIKGEPLVVSGQRLVPLVRVTSRVRREADLSGDAVGGQGLGFVHMRPVAILDEGNDEQRHEVHDPTARALGRLLFIALLMPWLATLAVILVRRMQTGCPRGTNA